MVDLEAIRRNARRASPLFLLGGLAAMAAYVLVPSSLLREAVLLGVGLASTLAIVVGPLLYRPDAVRGWRLIAVSCGLFLVGAAWRAAGATGEGSALPDIFTVSGYLAMLSGFAVLLRSRAGRDPESSRNALIDAAILGVCLGGLVLVHLALPATQVPGRPQWVSVLAGIYPAFDVVLGMVLLQFAFTTALREPAYWMLAASLGALLAGDVGYAVIGLRGQLVAPAWMDTPFILAYVFGGAAALHPSMVGLSGARPVAVQAWSWWRIALLAAALLVPPALVLFAPPTSGQRAVAAGAVVAATGLLLLRAVSAVRAAVEAHRVLRHQLTHDALTGLDNRAHLVDQLDTLTSRLLPGERVGVLFVDLDGFKLVNDTWGHEAGDELLVKVAAQLRETVRDDDLVARVGGDEFVVASRVPDVETAVRLARRIVLTVSRPTEVAGAETSVSPAIGVAVSERGSTSLHLIRDADTAMYRAKAAGPGQVVVFDTAMHDSLRWRVERELALRYAVDRDELRLHYQPIVDLVSGRQRGYEALLRWDHPLLGRVPPDEFVPLAEQCGLIGRIGRSVLGRALHQLARWQADSGDTAMTMAINVSSRQLHDDRIVQDLRRLLAATGLDPANVHLEITETAMIEDEPTVREVLRRLDGLGVVLYLDDFGTGWSALGLLRSFPIRAVKIDRSFVAGLGMGEGSDEIVRALVGVAHALGLGVVAEGIETTQQRDWLRDLGVERGQGLLFGMPAPPEALDHHPSGRLTA